MIKSSLMTAIRLPANLKVVFSFLLPVLGSHSKVLTHRLLFLHVGSGIELFPLHVLVFPLISFAWLTVFRMYYIVCVCVFGYPAVMCVFTSKWCFCTTGIYPTEVFTTRLVHNYVHDRILHCAAFRPQSAYTKAFSVQHLLVNKVSTLYFIQLVIALAQESFYNVKF